MTDVRPALRDHEPRRLVDWWYVVRGPLLRSARFQRWAAAFPLTRPIARRRAGELFDLVSGFVYSQILHAVVRLRVLDLVADEPMTVEAIAPAIGLDIAATRRLCSAAAAVRLLSDADRAVMRAYGAYGLKKLYGKEIEGVIRSTFVVDVDAAGAGTIAVAQYNVKATGHVARLRRELGL